MISRAETSGVRGTTATTRLTLSAPLRLKMRLASSRSARFLSCICLAWFLRLNLLLDAVTLALVVFGCDLSEGRCVRPFAASLSELLDECFDLNGLFVWLCVGRCENAEGGAGGAIARGSRGRREESKPLSAEEKIGATAFGAKSDFCQIGTRPPRGTAVCAGGRGGAASNGGEVCYCQWEPSRRRKGVQKEACTRKAWGKTAERKRERGSQEYTNAAAPIQPMRTSHPQLPKPVKAAVKREGPGWESFLTTVENA